MHKTVLTWFDNLPMSIELQGFNYYQVKNTKSGSTVFFLSKTTTTNPNHQS